MLIFPSVSNALTWIMVGLDDIFRFVEKEAEARIEGAGEIDLQLLQPACFKVLVRISNFSIVLVGTPVPTLAVPETEARPPFAVKVMVSNMIVGRVGSKTGVPTITGMVGAGGGVLPPPAPLVKE